MVFKKIIGKEGAPNNLGTGAGQASQAMLKKYYLEFPGLDGSPTFLLEGSLSIGSESGDIVLEEEGIAPSHCSVNLNQDVLSIVDHGSTEGTFVNKKRVSPGKMILLSFKDKLRVGNIDFRIDIRDVADVPPELESPVISAFLANQGEDDPPPAPGTEVSTPEVPSSGLTLEDGELRLGGFEEKTGAMAVDKLLLESQAASSEVVVPPLPSRTSGKKMSFKTKGVVTEASNGFLRVLGFLADVLLVGVLHESLSGEPAVKEMLAQLPKTASEIFSPLFNEYAKPQLETLYQSLPALKNAQDFALSFYKEEHIVFVQFALVLILWRFVTPLIFGATLGQCLVGIRGKGSFLMKRILSPLREFIGLLTLPLFWIFDFPTLFSKRSLKEVLSFTHLETPSSLIAILSIALFIPVLVIGLLTGPLWRGMEIPEPMPFKSLEKIELGVFDASDIDAYSGYFKLGIPAKQAAYILPQFKFTQKKGRKSLEPFFVLGKDAKTRIEVKILKQLSLVDFLGAFSKANPMTELNYPEIAKLVHDASNTNKNFKDVSFPEEALAHDMRKLMMWSMGMLDFDPEKIIGFLKDNGPFVGAFVEFRNKLLSVMGEGAKSFEMRQIGNAIQIVADYSAGNKVIKRLLPLNGKETKVYEIAYPKGADTAMIELMAYNPRNKMAQRTPLVKFVDALTPGRQGQDVEELFQATAQAYYDLAKSALLEDNQALYNDLTHSLQGALDILMNNSNALGLPERASNKLTQNLSDLSQALRERDLKYFGVSSVGSLEEPAL